MVAPQAAQLSHGSSRVASRGAAASSPVVAGPTAAAWAQPVAQEADTPSPAPAAARVRAEPVVADLETILQERDACGVSHWEDATIAPRLRGFGQP